MSVLPRRVDVCPRTCSRGCLQQQSTRGYPNPGTVGEGIQRSPSYRVPVLEESLMQHTELVGCGIGGLQLYRTGNRVLLRQRTLALGKG